MEEELKLCPMYFGTEGQWCAGQGCAWWDERYSQCAILTIAEAI